MNCLNKFKFSLFIILGILFISNANAAETFPFNGQLIKANGIGYSIKIIGNGQEHVISITDIEKLSLHKANFDTKWDLKGDFVGVKLSYLLSHVGITKFKRLYVLASNDYKITIENNDPGIENVILASRINGKPFALDNKGPFFIIWPDQAEDLLVGKASATKWLWGAIEIRKIR
ncbi:MAG: hypothetical protein ACI9YO_000991 [Gammaproteobacteria bacterium]|jgi:hypothetical protein